MAGGFDEKAGGAQMGVMQGPMVGLQFCAARIGGGHLSQSQTPSDLRLADVLKHLTPAT